MDLIYYLASESGGRDKRLVLRRALVPKEVTCTVSRSPLLKLESHISNKLSSGKSESKTAQLNCSQNICSMIVVVGGKGEKTYKQ